MAQDCCFTTQSAQRNLNNAIRDYRGGRLSPGPNSQTVNAQCTDCGSTPVHVAVACLKWDLLPVLVGCEPNLCIEDRKGRTALIRACENRCHSIPRDKVGLLITSQNINTQENIHRRTALLSALHNGYFHCAEVLLERGADVTVTDKFMQNAVHIACKLGVPDDLLQNLLNSASVDLNLQDIEGNAPIHIAFKNKHSSNSLAKNLRRDFSMPLDMILTLKNINLQDKDGNSPLHLALKGKHFDDAKFLLQHSPDTTLQNGEQMTALHMACYVNAPLELVQKIISDENINIKDNRGNTALFYAVKSESLLPLVFAYDVEIDYKYISLAERKTLAEAIIHSDVCSDAFHKSARDYVLPMIISRANLRDARWRTALHHLVLTNNNAFLMDVAQSGVECKDMCDAERNTPLHYAMTMRKTFDEGLIDALITSTNANIQDRHGYTPLHWMISNWPKWLFHYLEGNNNVSEIGKRITTKLITKQNINLKSNINMTLLRFVVRHKRWDLIPSVLERGADVCSLFFQIRQNHAIKYTILHDAIEHHVPADTFKLIISHENAKLDCRPIILCCAISRQRWDLMQLLLNYGADINAPCRDHTALHRAIQARNTPLEIVAQLISPENISMETNSGETAKTLAIQTEQWHVFKLLLSHGYRQTGPLSLLCGLTIKQYVPEEVSKRLPPKMWNDIETLGEYLSSDSF